MPDNLQLNVGVGGLLAAAKEVTHGGDTAQLQAISIMGVSGSEGSYVIADINGSAANGLEVDVTRVSGTVLVDGSAVIQPVHDANLISTDNSTTTPLGIGVSFVGTGEDVSEYSTVSVILDSSHDSAVDGMTFEFSTDNVNWDETHIFTYTAADGARHFQLPVVAQYFRVNYTNGGTAQTTFRVQTILHVDHIGTTIHRLVENVDPDRSATIVKSVVLAQGAGTGDFIPVQATAVGNFKVSLEEVNGSVAGGGIEATALRVTMANDSTGLLAVDGSGFTQPIFAAALPLPVGAATAVGQLPDGHNVTVDNASLIVDGSGVTQPISAVALPLPTGAATSANQLADGHNVTVDNTVGSPANVQIGDGTSQVSVSGDNALFITGDANHNGVDVGRPVKIGGHATTAKRTDVSLDDDRVDASFDLAGQLRVTSEPGDPLQAQIGDGTSQTEIRTVSGDSLAAGEDIYLTTLGMVHCFNGTTWDRIRGDVTNGLDVDVTRTPADAIDGAVHGGSQIGFRMMGTDGANDRQIAVGGVGNLLVEGNQQHASADGGRPIKVGGHATAVLRAAVTEADRVDSSFDLQGQQRTISGVTTSGGTTFYKNLDVDNTEDAVKVSAGQLYWIHCINLGSAVRYLKFYDDTVGNVIVGTTVPDLTFPIPTQGDSNGAGFTLSIPNGIAFGTAITVAATVGFADNDSADPGDNEVILNLGFA